MNHVENLTAMDNVTIIADYPAYTIYAIEGHQYIRETEEFAVRIGSYRDGSPRWAFFQIVTTSDGVVKAIGLPTVITAHPGVKRMHRAIEYGQVVEFKDSNYRVERASNQNLALVPVA